MVTDVAVNAAFRWVRHRGFVEGYRQGYSEGVADEAAAGRPAGSGGFGAHDVVDGGFGHPDGPGDGADRGAGVDGLADGPVSLD